MDPALEIANLEKKLSQANARADTLRKKMSVPSYQEKTPATVRQDDEDRLAKAEAEAAAAQQHIEEMKKMIEGQQ